MFWTSEIGGEVREVRIAYRTDKPNEKSVDLAEKVTALVIDSDVTYKEAMDALEAAQDLLMEKTVPVRNGGEKVCGV